MRRNRHCKLQFTVVIRYQKGRFMGSQNVVPSTFSTYEQSLLDCNALASVIVPFLHTLEVRLRSANSWRVYKQDIKHFILWLASESITDIKDIRVDDMYEYHAHLRDYRYGPQENKAYSNATINRMFIVARR